MPSKLQPVASAQGALAPSAAQARAYRPDIDGLRALAILSVVLYHCGLSGLSGGFTGVDIFFAISGYLIGGHIYSEIRAGNFHYSDFYRLRAKRILPAFFAVILFTLLLGLVLLSPFEYARLARAATASTLSVPNFLFWHSLNYFEPHGDWQPLLMTWSLGVEEQFYLLIPALLLMLTRLRKNIMLPALGMLCVASFLLALWQLNGHSQSAMQAAFYLLPGRAWELGVGVVLAVFTQSTSIRIKPPKGAWIELCALLGLIAILLPCFLLRPLTRFPGAAALPSVMGTAMLMSTSRSAMNRRVLALPPLVFIGRISYSWYLFHWPVLSLLSIVSAKQLPLTLSLAAAAISFLLAVISYYCIEQPFRASRLAAKPILIRYACATACLLAICGLLWMSHGVPQRFPALAKLEVEPSVLNADGCMLSGDKEIPSTKTHCSAGNDTHQLVAIWGDSHAAALVPALRTLANAQGFGTQELLKSACLPLENAWRYVPAAPALTGPCHRFNHRALEEIRGNPRVRVVVLAGDWKSSLALDAGGGWIAASAASLTTRPTRAESQQRLQAALAAELRALREAGKEIVLVEEVPNFDFQPMQRVRNTAIPLRRALASWLRLGSQDDPGFAPLGDTTNDALATKALQDAAFRDSGIHFWNPKQNLCDAHGDCFYRTQNTMLYLDDGHVTPAGAEWAVRGLRMPE